MTLYVGLDVSQKLTAICAADDTGRRLWRTALADFLRAYEVMAKSPAAG